MGWERHAHGVQERHAHGARERHAHGVRERHAHGAQETLVRARHAHVQVEEIYYQGVDTKELEALSWDWSIAAKPESTLLEVELVKSDCTVNHWSGVVGEWGASGGWGR